ncbi:MULTISPECIES: fluoride efflux transporter CrcB [unclassified Gordonia (in: high G+C Gram-positive bacteria)]|uniref:fluoride efflux transporter CrcB n=1 Tax=unclassified Gordonia (in: high G+C Gram-positive bacteria) TaxID=2657482 RepID=UPI001F0D2560|nr:fluoride efflux transporter CrcB [Gordonia sp. ABSL49_1]MCH5644817.1 fluoride efflux transporter CrcB [Gordonia sp. ABSL49_1]
MADHAADSHPELPLDPDSSRPLHLQWRAIALVFLGGIAGTGLRYLTEHLFPAYGTDWPWATFGVNLSGAFILGALLEVLALAGPDDGWRRTIRVLVGTGFCGSYTTYSSFALETTQLGHHGAVGLGIAYAASSVVLGVVCAWAGIVVAGQLLRGRGAVS